MRFEYPEGATLINDISDLKPDWVKTQDDLNQVEAENISSATSKYLVGSVGLPEKWFTVTFLQKIHHDMLGEVWDWAGTFRRVQTIPGVSPYRIRGDLENLCNDVSFWRHEGAELTFLEQAARIHHQLVFIHPFPNGNGRFARLVADRYLKAWKCPIPHWPTDLNNNGQRRRPYIESLKEADRGNLEPLICYMEDHGGRDPSLSELFGGEFFRKCYKGKQLELLVKALIRRGCDVNDVENDGYRPLNVAVRHGLKNIALLLLDRGATFREKDRSGLNAFEMAIRQEFYDIAYEIYLRGYPYKPKDSNPNFKVSSRNLKAFDELYF